MRIHFNTAHLAELEPKVRVIDNQFLDYGERDDEYQSHYRDSQSKRLAAKEIQSEKVIRQIRKNAKDYKFQNPKLSF